MNTLTTLFLALLCLACVHCKHQEPNDSFTLKGKITGLDTGRIILRTMPDSMPVYDTAIIRNGEFIFKGKIHEPLTAELNAGNDSNTAYFYLEPAEMKIYLTLNKFSAFRLTGSTTEEESVLLKSQLTETMNIRRSLNEEYFKNQEVIDRSNDEGIKKRLAKQNDSIDKLIKQSILDDSEIRLKFVKTHPKSYLSPFNLLTIYEKDCLSLDSTKSLFSQLEPKVKKSKDGRFLTSFIKMNENTQIGAMAPDFKAIDINGQPISLSQFRHNKVILIEFWASWCRPCRSSFPMLKSIHGKYSAKGFDIIAIVYFDINKESWEMAIKQERVENWHHLATIFQRDPPINNTILRDYPVGAIPMSFLIDKSGKVVGSWKGYSAETEKELINKLDELLN